MEEVKAVTKAQQMEAPAKAPKGTHRTIKLDPRHGMDKSVHLLDRPSALAINAALAARRPLLVRGEPGVGKSQLARAAADDLGRAFVHYTVNSRTETDELLFEVDLVARLAEAQFARGEADREKLELKKFVRPGPMWWALNWETAEQRLTEYQKEILGSAELNRPDEPSENGVVVLIDELDKADASVPNGLLDALGHRGFGVPGHGRVCLPEGKPAPLVMFTTNRERTLPDAFLRRCFVHTLTLPEDEEGLRAVLRERADAHNARLGYGLDAETLGAAVGQIVQERLSKDARQRYRAGVAELLDLLAAVAHAPEPAALVRELARFIRKDQGDAR